MNPFVNYLAGFGGGFIAFWPVEASEEDWTSRRNARLFCNWDPFKGAI